MWSNSKYLQLLIKLIFRLYDFITQYFSALMHKSYVLLWIIYVCFIYTENSYKNQNQCNFLKKDILIYLCIKKKLWNFNVFKTFYITRGLLIQCDILSEKSLEFNWNSLYNYQNCPALWLSWNVEEIFMVRNSGGSGGTRLSKQ